MDFVPGENLFQAVKRRGALPEAEIVPCIRQIGEALIVVHQAGLVHRDAHPGNIMLRSNGKAVLIDFGIAKELVPRTLSSTGDVGNKGFAPYEQLVNGSREPTVDVYCLAATLYYAVTGQCPTTSLTRKYSKDDQDTDPLISPKDIPSSISDKLNYAIIKGMALEAKDRPQSMQDWLDMLEAPKPTPPPPVEPVHKTEVVRPKTKPKSTPDKPATKSPDHPQSIWLAMLEAQKATPPPPVVPVHRQEVVRSKAKPKSTPHKPATKSPRIIPWVRLVGILFIYIFIGYCLALALYKTPLLQVVCIWVFVWAFISAFVWTVAVAGTWTGAWVWVAVSAWAWVVASTGAGVWAWAWAWVVASTQRKLQQSFSNFHTFLILIGTSNLGLSLGWLGHRIYTNS
jgi:serine/threonine-protein kinase